MNRTWALRTWWRQAALVGLLLAFVGLARRRRRPFDPTRPSIDWGLVSLRIDDVPPTAQP
jgi:hypothetical protein